MNINEIEKIVKTHLPFTRVVTSSDDHGNVYNVSALPEVSFRVVCSPFNNCGVFSVGGIRFLRRPRVQVELVLDLFKYFSDLLDKPFVLLNDKVSNFNQYKESLQKYITSSYTFINPNSENECITFMLDLRKYESKNIEE